MKNIVCAFALATSVVTVSAADQPVAAPAPKATAAPNAVAAAAPRPGTAARSPAEVRNWAEIDTNRDHLISAEEMEKWLAGQWAKSAPKK